MRKKRVKSFLDYPFQVIHAVDFIYIFLFMCIKVVVVTYVYILLAFCCLQKKEIMKKSLQKKWRMMKTNSNELFCCSYARKNNTFIIKTYVCVFVCLRRKD